MPDKTTLIPYLFQPGLRETLTFLTKVMVSNNGYEQRMRLRNAPRQSFSFNIAVPRGEIAKLDTMLYGNRGAEFYLPVSSEARLLDIATSGSSPDVDVSTEFADFRVGSQALIWNTHRDFEIITILSISSNQIVADANISKVYPVTAFVMPLRIGVFQANPKRRTTGDTQRIAGNFRVKENIKLATSPTALQYKNFDTYLDHPLTIDRYAIDVYDTRVDVVDFGTGLTEEFAPHIRTKIQRSFGLQFNSQEDVWNFRLWLNRRAGKYEPFWMPTWENNFKLLSTGFLTTTLIVANDGQDTLSDGRDDVAILTDAGWTLRGIVSIAPSGNDLQLVLDISIGVDASAIKLISFLGRERLTSDKMNIVWDGNNTGHATVGITEVNGFVSHEACVAAAAPGASCTTVADVMLVIDNTGSQKRTTYYTEMIGPINNMIQDWIDLEHDFTVGTVLIVESPVLREALTSDLASIQTSNTAIASPSGRTNLADAILVARSELNANGRGGVEVIVIITDGAPNFPNSITAYHEAEVAAQLARDDNMRVVVFGVLGQDLTNEESGGGGGG